MKVGVLTFHASHNYGSMLQAYALQHVLGDMGVENEIINLRTSVQRGLIPPAITMSHPRSSLRQLIKLPVKTIKAQKKYNRFERFLSQDLKLTAELDSYDDVEKYIGTHKYDALIVGSDQIWNTGCYDFDKSYVLSFENNDFKRIAYAPSLGSFPEKTPKEKIDWIIGDIKRFDFLSTREQRGADFISPLIDRHVEVVLDPTLLLDQNSYKKLYRGKPIVEGKYLFYYTPREEPGTFDKVREIADKLRLKIVVTQQHPDYVGENIIYKTTCGPREFLNIIANAAFTAGKSFHLMVFSILFHKEFLMVSRDHDSRFTNVLDKLGLSGRIVNPDDRNVVIPSAADFGAIDEKMIELRKSSLDYLRNALN